MTVSKPPLVAVRGKPLLTKKNAAYAAGAGLIADIIASFFASAYSGLFSGIARLLTGGM